MESRHVNKPMQGQKLKDTLNLVANCEDIGNLMQSVPPFVIIFVLTEKIFNSKFLKTFYKVSESWKKNILRLLLVCPGEVVLVLVIILPDRQINSIGGRTGKIDG